MSKQLQDGSVEFDANDVFRMAASHYKKQSERRLVWIRILLVCAGVPTGFILSRLLLWWLLKGL